jgi:hypothetical protein
VSLIEEAPFAALGDGFQLGICSEASEYAADVIAFSRNLAVLVDQGRRS